MESWYAGCGTNVARIDWIITPAGREWRYSLFHDSKPVPGIEGVMADSFEKAVEICEALLEERCL